MCETLFAPYLRLANFLDFALSRSFIRELSILSTFFHILFFIFWCFWTRGAKLYPYSLGPLVALMETKSFIIIFSTSKSLYLDTSLHIKLYYLFLYRHVYYSSFWLMPRPTSYSSLNNIIMLLYNVLYTYLWIKIN